MNLPALYAAVCAKRPELEVKIDRGEGCEQRIERGWDAWQYNTHYGDGRQITNFTSDEIAAALILARWVEALPVGLCLANETPRMWGVDGNGTQYAFRPTPIEALAAYYLGQ